MMPWDGPDVGIEDAISRTIHNLGFSSADEWAAFWTNWNTRGGSYEPYSPRNSSSPSDRMDLIVRALRGEQIDLHALPEFKTA